MQVQKLTIMQKGSRQAHRIRHQVNMVNILVLALPLQMFQSHTDAILGQVLHGIQEQNKPLDNQFLLVLGKETSHQSNPLTSK